MSYVMAVPVAIAVSYWGFFFIFSKLKLRISYFQHIIGKVFFIILQN